jgi:replicative DNA helicase
MENENDNKKRIRTGNFTKNSVSDMGKVQPQAVDMEEAVLGALMLEKEAIVEIADVLNPDCFYLNEHQEIYRAILDLFNDSQAIDVLTVKDRLVKNGKFEFVGGGLKLAQLTNKVNSAANIEFHARVVLEKYIKRSIINISGKLDKMAYEDTTDVFQLLDTAEQMLFQVSENNIRKNYVGMKDLMFKALKELEGKKDKKDGLTGIPTGLKDLDRLTSGFQRSDLIIIAARPAMGKTAFVLSVLRNAAVDFQMPVAIFSLEMSAIQLVNRLISAEAEIESEVIKKGTLSEHQWKQLHEKITKISEAPIFIDDTPALTVLELRAKARRLKAQHNIEMLIVDYLQLMSGGDVGKGNREQEIGYISRSLKNIAKELNIPVIALSQLSRAVETRGGDKKPQLSDLRESGSIEQDADIVMFLYRPEYYQITQDEQGLPTAGVGEIIVAKHRNGSLDNVKLRFIGKYTKFTNLDDMMGGYGADEMSFPNVDTMNNFENESTLPNNTITLGSKLNNRTGDSNGLPKNFDLDGNMPF